MIAIETRVRRWGHSLGLVIPKEKAKLLRLRSGDKMEALIFKKKTNVLREVFGTAKFSKSVKEMMKEDDKLLYDV